MAIPYSERPVAAGAFRVGTAISRWLRVEAAAAQKRRSSMERTMSDRRGLLMIILMLMTIGVFLSPVAGRAGIPGSSERSLPDDPGRFNGLWWGQSLAELKEMRFVSPDPVKSGELYYVWPRDVLQLGDAKLEYVQYGFWKGVYSSVAFGIRGVENWEALKSICFENFERWHKPNRYVDRYYWVGKHSAMTLRYDEVLAEGQLYVYSKVIYERQLARERQGTGRRSGGGFWLW